MNSSRLSPAFSFFSVMTGAVVLAGAAAICLPVLVRRFDLRARQVRQAAARTAAQFDHGLDAAEALAGDYARELLQPTPGGPAGPPLADPPVPQIVALPAAGPFPLARFWRLDDRPRLYPPYPLRPLPPWPWQPRAAERGFGPR